MYLLKRTGFVLMTILIMLPIVNAQARYRHVPRVKAEPTKLEKAIKPNEEAITHNTTAAYLNVEENNVVATPTSIDNENTMVVSSSNEVIIVKEKTNSVVKHSPVIKNTKRESKQAFTDKLKKSSKIMEVKDVKKSAVLIYLLWFFIVLFICIALFVFAFVFFQTFFSIYPIFLTLAIVVLAIALVILIMGLLGAI